MPKKRKIARRGQLAPGEVTIICLEDGREVALYNVEGTLHALDNSCPHMGGPLGEGELEGAYVTCPWHGWRFDVRSGECENMPGECAKRLKVAVEGEDVYLTD